MNATNARAQDELPLRVLSFNCWGIPAITQDLDTRMVAIGQALGRMELDIAGLQEVVRPSDRERILAGASAGGLTYGHYYSSGMVGSGLLLLSRFPIEEVGYLPYRLNGRPQDLMRPDYYAGKGVGWARLRTPAGPVDSYNTHLIAEYLEFGPDVYHAHRVAQAFELARFIDSRSAGTPAVLTGDLNTPPGSLVYRICQSLARLHDSYAVANPGLPGYTVTPDNPYVGGGAPKRIDYVFFRNSPDQAWRVEASEVVLRQVAPPFQTLIPAYSDHYGVASSLLLAQDPGGFPSGPEVVLNPPEVTHALDQGTAQAQAQKARSGLGAVASLTIASLLLLGRSKTRLSRRRFLRVAALILALICLPLAVAFLSMVLGLSGEVATLKEIRNEVEAWFES
jgi:sphingomyelin phosphodiesterase 2